MFTDPRNHEHLHENHVKKYNNYFVYWYKEDLYAYDALYEAIKQNGLIEATLAGGWISVMLWVGSIIFIIIQRTYIRREKNKFDRFSGGQSTYQDSMRKEGSVMSGSGYYNGNKSNFSRGGLRGSDQSMKSVRSRREMDDLGFASLGLSSHTGTMTSGYQSNIGHAGTIPRHVPHVYQGDQVPRHVYPGDQVPRYPAEPVHYNVSNNYPRQIGGQTYLQDNMETEIM